MLLQCTMKGNVGSGFLLLEHVLCENYTKLTITTTSKIEAMIPIKTGDMCLFLIRSANFGPSRPVISEERDHLFQTIASTCFGLIATIILGSPKEVVAIAKRGVKPALANA